MKCRKCGAELLETDTFCVNCGQKVEKIMVCPECGEELRDGERYCHNCGAMITSEPMDDEIPVVQQKTVDIPFDMIEQGLLMEAEHAIKKRPEAEKPKTQEAPPQAYYEERPVRKPSEEYYEERPVRRPSEEYYEERPARRPPEKRYQPRQEEYDEEDNDGSKMKIVTIILGIAIAVIIAVVAFIVWNQHSGSKYERKEEDMQQEEGSGEENTDSDSEGNSGDGLEIQGRLQILSNVNVRNKPSTEDSTVLMVAKAGETYRYYELVNDSWYHIELEDGTDGYVSKKYVEDLE